MKKTILLFAIAALGFSSIAHATLINRGADSLGNRLIYDTDLNITWYDYTNSRDTWQNQMNWASNLSVTYDGQVFDDWRLPSTVDGPDNLSYDDITSLDFNNTSSEMGHLYYTELGNLGYVSTSGAYPQSGYGLQNTGDFQHLRSYDYWSGTEYSLDTNRAWYFAHFFGLQHSYYKDHWFGMNALAVRSGDVVAAHTNPVPEPGTWMLLGSGLVGLAAFRKRFTRQ